MRLRDYFTRTALGLFLLVIAGVTTAHGGSATWILNPDDGDWNTATNWFPDTVPNGPTDVATFGVSNNTAISFSQSVEVNAIDFTAGASAFTISVDPRRTLTISGAGVSNASGIGQNFATFDRNGLGAGAIVFTNSATAGVGNTYTNNGRTNGLSGVASTQFFGTSNAGSSIIINTSPRASLSVGGFTAFFGQSSAANSTIINAAVTSGSILDSVGSTTSFNDNSTAGNATLVAQGSNAVGDDETEIDFLDQSTADHATITLEGGGSKPGAVSGAIRFEDSATAGNAAVTLLGAAAGGGGSGFGQFLGSATAGSATFLLQGGMGAGPTLCFFDTSSGGEAAFTVNGNAVLDISFHSAPGMAVGSLAGDGIVTVGTFALSIGTNNQSTAFGGTIQGNNGSTGSVIKTGTGTLILSGANTYGAGTTIQAGTLLAATVNASATGGGAVQVDAGILGGGGVISGAVTLGTGSGAGAFLAPAAGTTQHKTLRLQSSLTLKSDATYTVTFIAKTNRAQTDKVFANGVTISDATIAIEGIAQGALTAGTVITLISNTGANPINGTFQNLSDGAIVMVNGNNLLASYTGGDGNDLTLTVVP
jgi:autotransporter-associated beta strand protein